MSNWELIEHIVAISNHQPFTDKYYGGTGYMCENFTDKFSIQEIKDNNNTQELTPTDSSFHNSNVTINYSWHSNQTSVFFNNNQIRDNEEEYYKYMFCDRYFVDYCKVHLIPNIFTLDEKEQFTVSNR